MRTITQKLRSKTSVFAVVLLALGVVACTASGSARGSGTITNPLGNDLIFDFSLGNDGKTTGTVTGLPPGKCLETTWTGADGAEVGTTSTPIDATGTASGQVPDGAVRWQSKVVDCSEAETKTAPKDTFTGSGQVTVASGGQHQRVALGGAEDYVCFGGPVFPESALGAENTTYYFIVRAFSSEQADAIVDSILVSGLSAPVPSSVKVIEFSQMISTTLGARFISASPDGYLDWRFDFNNGAHIADSATGQNVLNYAVNGWDVMETMIPLTAFDFSVIPGASYQNSGVVTSSTAQFPQVGTSSYSYLNYAE